MMNEKLLQFIWRFQYFRQHPLFTTAGEPMSVEKQGLPNTDQGPDFYEARIRIGNTVWAGDVELHIRSSDWYRHAHETDIRYRQVILHVVWEEDRPVYDAFHNRIPALELQPLVPQLMIEKYSQLMASITSIPCRSFLPAMDRLHWQAWLERLAVERLERKTADVLQILHSAGGNWDETLWRVLAANMGGKVNRELFSRMAETIPFSVLIRHRHQLLQMEALLMGQANLLHHHFREAYPQQLQREFRYLKKKYKLQPVAKQAAFLRMRPGSFPTIRLAQLARLVQEETHWFARLRDGDDMKVWLQSLRVLHSPYWHSHYRFEEPAERGVQAMGEDMAINIILNTCVPVLFAYGRYTNDSHCREKAIHWWMALPAEQNRITLQWHQLGITADCALHSQALLELTNYYCTEHRCLNCSAGNKILGNHVL
jgi:hypothetical protein